MHSKVRTGRRPEQTARHRNRISRFQETGAGSIPASAHDRASARAYVTLRLAPISRAPSQPRQRVGRINELPDERRRLEARRLRAGTESPTRNLNGEHRSNHENDACCTNDHDSELTHNSSKATRSETQRTAQATGHAAACEPSECEECQLKCEGRSCDPERTWGVHTRRQRLRDPPSSPAKYHPSPPSAGPTEGPRSSAHRSPEWLFRPQDRARSARTRSDARPTATAHARKHDWRGDAYNNRAPATLHGPHAHARRNTRRTVSHR